MTGQGLTQRAFEGLPNVQPLGGGWASRVNLLRPLDGWFALALLAINLMMVVGSVASADWAPGLGNKSIVAVLLMGMLTGLVLGRLPVWGWLLFPAGLGVGLAVVAWQIGSFFGGESAVTGTGQLWDRLGLWLEAAKSGDINIDPAPFAFGVLLATWLLGYAGVWLFARCHNFWGVLVLGGAGLLSNLTFLPPNAGLFLGLYLFTALLLIARIGSVRRQQEWQIRNIKPDGSLGTISLSDSFLLAVPVLIVAFSLPYGYKLGPMDAAYDALRSPMQVLEGDFNRLFAGVPARRPVAFRVWGDVMAFQGTINPAETVVLRVESPTPLYLKARTYGTYTGKGWLSGGRVLEDMDWTPSYASPQAHLDRLEVIYSVTPAYASNSLFVGGPVLTSDRNLKIETYDSATYTLDLTGDPVGPGAVDALPFSVAEAASAVRALVNQSNGRVGEDALRAALPTDLRLAAVSRDNGTVRQVQLAEVLPVPPDVLSLRSAGGKIKDGQTYTLTSAVSVASAEELREAGTDYPAWVMNRYVQLPVELPQRVRDLAADLTAGADTPYDKAKAIEEYLRTFPYTTTIEPPPFDADGVDHFLFTLGRGYSEYYASAMAVLLRSVNVPARLVTGYNAGNQVPDREAYVVADSNAHGWVEVFFPRYGWISFEPTAGRSLPASYQPGLQEETDQATGGAGGGAQQDDCIPLFADCPATLAQSPGSSDAEDISAFAAWFRRILPWLLSAVAASTIVTGMGWLLWRRYMTPSRDPGLSYRRLSLLGALSSNGPAPHQTPYEYRDRLGQALPAYREEVSAVVDAYVRNRYGAKGLERGGGRRLTRAWLRLRLPLLLRVIRWRNRQ